MAQDCFSLCVETYKNRSAVQRFIAQHPRYRDRHIKQLVMEFAERLPRGGEVLDVGSGPGYDVEVLRSKGMDATGIDVSGPMVERAVAEYGPYFSVLDARNVEILGHERFQGVLCICSLIHIPMSEWPLVLGSIRQVMRVGGILVLSMKEGCGVVRDERLGRDFPRFVQLCSRNEIDSFVCGAGFSEIDIRHVRGSASFLEVFATKAAK